ncbi:hypothetical protein NRB_09770 [Novosphingobium sp. 11B]
MLARKIYEDGRNAMPAKKDGERDAQSSGDFAAAGFQKGLASAQFLNRADATLIILLTVFRQALRSGGSLEQPDAEALLKARDGFSHR